MNYKLIEENLKNYKEASETFPIIKDYENGLVNLNTLSKFGLIDFGRFYDFMNHSRERGFELVSKISYRSLKELLVKNTTTDRFKKYIKNRTQKEFIEILNDPKKLDRLANGRITYRSRTTRRSNEKVQGIDYCIIAIINYIISNNIDINDGKFMSSFSSHSIDKIRWYIDRKLEFDDVPKREIDLTKNMIDGLLTIIEDSELDFRKMNLDYITDSLSLKLKTLMEIPEGTIIKAKRDVSGRWSTKALTKDNSYKVVSCHISNGKLRVMVKDDSDRLDYYDYRDFEDMALKRDQLLNQLLGNE